jgi:hypothetical protein
MPEAMLTAEVDCVAEVRGGLVQVGCCFLLSTHDKKLSPGCKRVLHLIATLSNIYLGHFRLAAIRLNDVPEAFRILESARGRAIADQLRSSAEPRPPNDEVTQGASKELQRVQIQLATDSRT